VFQAAEATYTTESWVISLNGLERVDNRLVWTLRLETSDSRKTCSIAARGLVPKMVALPLSDARPTLRRVHGQIKSDSTSCYFEYTFAGPNTKILETIDIMVGEMVMDDLNVKIKRVRFRLPTYNQDAIPDYSGLTFESYRIMSRVSPKTSNLVTFDVIADSTNTVLVSPWNHPTNGPIVSHLTGSPAATKACTDGMGQNANFVQEINGVVYRRWAGQFEKWTLDGIVDHVPWSDGVFEQEVMNAECPQRIIASPRYWLRDSIIIARDDEFTLFTDNGPEPRHWTYTGHAELLDVAFDSKRVNYLYVFTGKTDYRTLKSCQITADYSLECEVIASDIFMGSDTLDSYLSLSNNYPNQPQYAYASSHLKDHTLQDIEVDGNRVKVKQMVSSPYAASDVFVMTADSQLMVQVRSNGTAEIVDDFNNRVADVSGIVGLDMISSSSVTVYYIESGKLKVSSFLVNSYYSTGVGIVVKSSGENIGLAFNLSPELGELQGPEDYTEFQSYWWLSGQDQSDPIELYLQQPHDLDYKSIEAPENSDANFTIHQVASGGEAIIISRPLDNLSIRSVTPGEDIAIPEFIDIEYRDSVSASAEPRTQTVSIPVRIGCDKHIELRFDHDAARSVEILGSPQAHKSYIREEDIEIRDFKDKLVATAYTFLHSAPFYPRFALHHKQTEQSVPYLEDITLEIDSIWPIVSKRNPNDPKMLRSGWLSKAEVDELKTTSIYHAWMHANGENAVESHMAGQKPYGKFREEDRNSANNMTALTSILMKKALEQNCRDEDGKITCRLGDVNTGAIGTLEWNCHGSQKWNRDSPCDHFVNYLLYQERYEEQLRKEYPIYLFGAPCVMNSVRNKWRSIFYEIPPEDVEDNCFTPDYLVHIKAKTVNSKHHCDLETDFYIRLASVPLSNISKLIIMITISVSLGILILMIMGNVKFDSYYQHDLGPRLHHHPIFKVFFQSSNKITNQASAFSSSLNDADSVIRDTELASASVSSRKSVKAKDQNHLGLDNEQLAALKRRKSLSANTMDQGRRGSSFRARAGSIQQGGAQIRRQSIIDKTVTGSNTSMLSHGGKNMGLSKHTQNPGVGSKLAAMKKK